MKEAIIFALYQMCCKCAGLFDQQDCIDGTLFQQIQALCECQNINDGRPPRRYSLQQCDAKLRILGGDGCVQSIMLSHSIKLDGTTSCMTDKVYMISKYVREMGKGSTSGSGLGFESGRVGLAKTSTGF